MHSANLFSGRTFRQVTAALIISSASCLGLAATASAQESTDPIKLTLHDWTGQLITTNLMAEILKKDGWEVQWKS